MQQKESLVPASCLLALDKVALIVYWDRSPQF